MNRVPFRTSFRTSFRTAYRTPFRTAFRTSFWSAGVPCCGWNCNIPRHSIERAFERDGTAGARSKGGIASLVERKSRYLLAAPLTDKSAATMTSGAKGVLKQVPPTLRRTLTVDNGKEFAGFKIIESQTGVCVYFADPYSAWQRGCNENTNGLLRQYFPKGSDLSHLSRTELALAVKRLNHRPRKCLGYQLPHEVFTAAIRGALHR